MVSKWISFLSFHPKGLTICVFFSTPNTLGGRLLSILFSRSRSSPDTVISSHLCFHLNTHRVTILGISSRLLPSMGTDIEVSGFLKGYINLTSTRNINYIIYILQILYPYLSGWKFRTLFTVILVDLLRIELKLEACKAPVLTVTTTGPIERLFDTNL